MLMIPNSSARLILDTTNARATSDFLSFCSYLDRRRRFAYRRVWLLLWIFAPITARVGSLVFANIQKASGPGGHLGSGWYTVAPALSFDYTGTVRMLGCCPSWGSFAGVWFLLRQAYIHEHVTGNSRGGKETRTSWDDNILRLHLVGSFCLHALPKGGKHICGNGRLLFFWLLLWVLRIRSVSGRLFGLAGCRGLRIGNSPPRAPLLVKVSP